jgi:hypothetical protein
LSLEVNECKPLGGGSGGGDGKPGVEELDAEAAAAMRQNQEQNISDAMAVLPMLATGLDVNVRWGAAG